MRYGGQPVVGFAAREGKRTMDYETPVLRELGSFSELTLGMGGSCPDGGGFNDNQLGGMSDCGVSGEMMMG